MLQLKVPHATTKIEDPACHNCDLVQPNKLKLKKKKGGQKASNRDGEGVVSTGERARTQWLMEPCKQRLVRICQIQQGMKQ